MKYYSICTALAAITMVMSGAMYSSSASAAEGNDCDKVLMQDIQISQLTRHQQLAWLSRVDKREFDEDRKHVEAAASLLGVSFAFDANADYEQFHKAAQSYLQENKFDFQEDIAQNLMVAGIRDKAIDAWLKCKTSPRNFEGVVAVPVVYSDKLVSVKVSWHPHEPRGDDDMPPEN